MSKPAFYRARPRWHSLVALVGAVAIEVAVVAAGSLVRRAEIPTITGGFEEKAFVGVLTDDAPEPVPDDPPPLIPPPPADVSDFVLTAPTPPPRPQSATRPKPTFKASVSRTTAPGTAAAVNFGSGQARMIFAPHPAYPFEARRVKQTGSGKFLLQFDASGNVTEAEVAQSTGSAVLDQVSLRTLRQWRCQPGVYERVYVPITFTLHGAQL